MGGDKRSGRYTEYLEDSGMQGDIPSHGEVTNPCPHHLVFNLPAKQGKGVMKLKALLSMTKDFIVAYAAAWRFVLTNNCSEGVHWYFSQTYFPNAKQRDEFEIKVKDLVREQQENADAYWHGVLKGEA